MDWSFGDWITKTQLHQRQVYGLAPEELQGEARAAYVRMNFLAAVDELMEALREHNWKPWKQDAHEDRDAIVGEIVDVLNFVGNVLAMHDVSGEELTGRYMSTLARNRRRQEEGY